MTAILDTPLPLASEREPGVYDGIPIDVYHADRTSLSASGAKEILASCPAKFRYLQDHLQPKKQVFELGTAAHHMVLGDGPELHVCDYGDWRTKAAQVERLEAQAEGMVALLSKEMAELEAMVAVLRNHHVAGPLFTPDSGLPEQSLYAPHRLTGVMRRARPDWLPHFTGERLRVPDYKTCPAADLGSIQRDIANYRYFQQAPWYLDLVKALGLCGDEEPVFLFVFQEKTAPYLITVVELDHVAMDIGRRENETALNTYAQCMARGVWPDYMEPAYPYLPQIALPAWLERQFA